MVLIGLSALKAIRIRLFKPPQAPSASFSMARTTFKPTLPKPNLSNIGLSFFSSSLSLASTSGVRTPAFSKPSVVPLTLMPGSVRWRSCISTSARLPSEPPRSVIALSSASLALVKMYCSALALSGKLAASLPLLMTVCFSTRAVFLPSGTIFNGLRKASALSKCSVILALPVTLAAWNAFTAFLCSAVSA